MQKRTKNGPGFKPFELKKGGTNIAVYEDAFGLRPQDDIMTTTILFILSILYSINIGASDEIRLSIGEKQHLYFPDLKKVGNLNPKLVNTKILEDIDEVIITALSKGNGKIFVHDHLGSRTLDVIVYSKMALDLEREIKELTSHMEGLSVKSIGHKVMIKGKVLTREDLETLKHIEKLYGENIILLTESTPSSQILTLKKMITLDVKMMEINKNKLHTLGLQFPDAISTHLSYAARLEHKTEMDILFHALEKKGLAKILANPKLVCKSGEEAQFTAGGEIPLRLAHRGNLSVQWKTYGILLSIKPIADSLDHIATTLKVEMSTLNQATAVEGIPGLTTRKVETSINVPNGKTIVLSGLVHQEKGDNIQGFPFLSSLPLLRYFFSYSQTSHKETELIILVTPSIHEESLS